MVEEFISISWVCNIRVWGKLATVFSSLLPSPLEYPNPDATRTSALPRGRNCLKLAMKLSTALTDYCFPTLVRPNAATIYRRAEEWSRERLRAEQERSCCCQRASAGARADANLTNHAVDASFSLVRVCLFRKIMKKKRQYWDRINKEINHFAIQCEPNLKINNYFKSYQAPITNITFIQLIHV